MSASRLPRRKGPPWLPTFYCFFYCAARNRRVDDGMVPLGWSAQALCFRRIRDEVVRSARRT